MVTGQLTTVICLFVSTLEGVWPQEVVEGHQLVGGEFQQYIWPATTRADMSLAHSSASHAFRQNRRHLLASSNTLDQATNGQGVIEYKPVGYNIDGADFAIFFARAYANSRATGIRLASGTYHVSPTVGNQAHLYMQCYNERVDIFEVDFSGVFFYFTDVQFQSMWVKNCTNLDLHGPYEQTYTTDQLDFVQGKIVGVSEDELTYTVEVDDAYPADRVMMSDELPTIMFHNDTLLMKMPDPYLDVFTKTGKKYRKKLGDRKFSFELSRITPNVTVGDYFIAKGSSGTVGLFFEENKNCTARDFTIYQSGGFGIYEPFSHDSVFKNVQIRPFPLPLGRDGKLPLLSTSWDGIHMTGGRGGTKILNSYIVNSGDDAIATSGAYHLVAAVDASKKAVIMRAIERYHFRPGDLLTFYAADTRKLGTAMVTKMYSVDQPPDTVGKTSKHDKDVKYDDADYMRVQLDSWPDTMNALQFDDVASSPSNRGDGFAFVNNTIGNLRGRGILSKSSNGVISHNRIFNLKGYAIQMSPEFLWHESDFVNNVLVLNNTINSYSGGMQLGTEASALGTPGEYTNNYNVDFVNNTLVNCGITPLFLTSAAGVSVINTTFINVLCTQNSTTLEWFNESWQIPGAIAMLANVDDITFLGNLVVKDARCKFPRGNYNYPVAMVNATAVSGLVPYKGVDSLLQAESLP